MAYFHSLLSRITIYSCSSLTDNKKHFECYSINKKIAICKTINITMVKTFSSYKNSLWRKKTVNLLVQTNKAMSDYSHFVTMISYKFKKKIRSYSFQHCILILKIGEFLFREINLSSRRKLPTSIFQQ